MNHKLVDIYWLAGLLEGDGCFSTQGSSPRGQATPTITLCMYDRDVVHRAHRILTPSQPPRSQAVPDRRYLFWRISLSGARAAGWMMTLYPLMGKRRQERIRELLARWRDAPFSRTRSILRRDELDQAPEDSTVMAMLHDFDPSTQPNYEDLEDRWLAHEI